MKTAQKMNEQSKKCNIRQRSWSEIKRTIKELTKLGKTCCIFPIEEFNIDKYGERLKKLGYKISKVKYLKTRYLKPLSEGQYHISWGDQQNGDTFYLE